MRGPEKTRRASGRGDIGVRGPAPAGFTRSGSGAVGCPGRRTQARHRARRDPPQGADPVGSGGDRGPAGRRRRHPGVLGRLGRTRTARYEHRGARGEQPALADQAGVRPAEPEPVGAPAPRRGQGACYDRIGRHHAGASPPVELRHLHADGPCSGEGYDPVGLHRRPKEHDGRGARLWSQRAQLARRLEEVAAPLAGDAVSQNPSERARERRQLEAGPWPLVPGLVLVLLYVLGGCTTVPGQTDRQETLSDLLLAFDSSEKMG
jgi:hypothetical protein